MSAAFALSAISAYAQEIRPSRVVEWNCPLIGDPAQPPPPDPGPGALVADDRFVWFVTRFAQPRLVRFQRGQRLSDGSETNGTCNWWDLELDSVQVGGLRLRPYGLQAFIRTFTNLQRIETDLNRRTSWTDGSESFSDVAVRKYDTKTYVYTTGVVPNPVQPEVVQRAEVSSNGTVVVTRWPVGGGAGTVYLSGIDVHPSMSNVIFYAEPLTNKIGRLTINNGTATIVRWDLSQADLTIFQPRQLRVTIGGLVYGVTGSGHVFQLNPTSNEVLVGLIPGADLNQPVGVDPDGLIGFTTAGDFSKVGAWFPDGTPVMVTPDPPETVQALAPVMITDTPDPVPQFTGPAPAIEKTAPSTELPSMNGNGIFFETNIDLGMPDDPAQDCPGGEDSVPDPVTGLESNPCAPSTSPQGIASDPNGGVGTYYAAVGNTLLRLAHVTIPVEAAGIATGGGWVNATATVSITTTTTSTADSGKGSFGFVAMRKRLGEPVKGHLTYTNHSSGGKVQSLQLTDLTFAGNKATIGGVCKDGSNCIDFRAQVEDNGQPTSPTRDRFEIASGSPLILGVAPAEGGPLEGGNLKVRQQQ
jgi:hypothetical protein